MGMELHARTRRDLEPDPEFDPICALFYCLSSDVPLQSIESTVLTGAIVVDKDCQNSDQGEVFHCTNPQLEPLSLCIRFFRIYLRLH